MKRVPLREKAGIDKFLKRYGKKATYVDSPYLGNYFRLEDSPNTYWMEDTEGNWYTDAPGFENKGYGPINNLIFDAEQLAPQLRKIYNDYGVDLSDLPDDANRNILMITGDERLNRNISDLLDEGVSPEDYLESFKSTPVNKNIIDGVTTGELR